MTVPTSTAKSGPYAGAGTTGPFTVGFRFLENSHLQVIRTSSTGVDTILALTTDYTVSGAGGASGSVTLVTALAVGQQLTVIRNVPFTQDADYVQNDAFPAESHERALDKLTMSTQQLKEAVDRAAKLPVTSTADAQELVADITLLADNIAGLTAVYGALPAITTVADDLNEPVSEINTVAVNIANVNAVGSNITNMNTVAGISANVTSVAGNATNINAVAGNETNINAVNANATNINTVAGASTNVNTVATNIASVNSAATNMAAIIAAPTQAASAAASAAAAAASAASGMYSAVQDKSANYTVVVGDAGDLIRVTTTSGAVTITLPLISSVSDGFKVAIVKWTGDTNQVAIARSGSDTINGATSASIGSQYTSTTFVADFETSQWLAVTSGLGSTNVAVDRFNGNGSTTAFTLSGSPGSLNNTYVFVGGVYQQKNTYSLSSTTLTFSAAPPTGTGNIEVVWTQPLAIGVPSDGTVTTVKIADANVTPAKFSADAQYSMQGFRNRIINGDMRIDQRNAGAATAGAGSSPYTLDRWKVYSAGANNPVQRVAGPAGYQYAMQLSGIASNTACVAFQRIEAANIADLASITATASFLIYNSGASFSATVRFQNPTTTVDDFSALTVIAGNSITIPNGWATVTTSVSLTAGVARGLQFELDLGAAMTAGRTVQITGVQLEAGSVSSPFERRDYGRELMMCQRYLPAFLGGSNAFFGSALNSTQQYVSVNFPVQVRAAPTGLVVSSASHFTAGDYISSAGPCTSLALSIAGLNNASVVANVTAPTTLTQARPGNMSANISSAVLYFTGCEL